MLEPRKVVLADDHPVVRRGLKVAIEEDPEYAVVAEANDGEAALALIGRFRPDVAVLDIDMPKLDGFDVARSMKRQEMRSAIIFLTLHADEDLFHAAMALGALGYILKDSAMQEIVVGLRAVADGRPYLSSAMTSRLLRSRAVPGPAPGSVPQSERMSGLTRVERQILKLVAAGRSSKEIGDDLQVHYRTVENHRTNICRKLRLEGANALLRFTLQNRSELAKL